MVNKYYFFLHHDISVLNPNVIIVVSDAKEKKGQPSALPLGFCITLVLTRTKQTIKPFTANNSTEPKLHIGGKDRLFPSQQLHF